MFKNRIIKISLYSLSLFPLLSTGMVSIAIILFIIGAVFNFKKSEEPFSLQKKTVYGLLFWFSLPLFLYLLALLWSDNISYGFSFVERSLAFIIFPVIFFVFKPFKNVLEIERFIRYFIVSSAFLSFFTIVFVCINVFYIKGYNFSNKIFTFVIRKEIDNVPIIGEHSIYFSLILGCAIIFMLFFKFKNRGLNILIITILSSGLLFSSARGSLIALSIIITVQIFTIIKNKTKAIILIVAFYFCTIGIVYNSPIKDRFIELVNTKYIYPKGTYYNSFNIRMGIYNCAFNIAKTTPFYGYGSGGVKEKLNDCYSVTYDTEAYNKKDYNTHNQFFHFWICFGFFGFLLICYSLFYYLRKAMLFMNRAHVFFLIFFYISFFTENILNRNTGIVLFTMFNSLFYYITLLKNGND